MGTFSSFSAMDAEVDAMEEAGADDESVLPCKRNRAFFRIAIRNEFGEPYANRPFILTVDGETWDRVTGGDGIVEQELADTAKEGTLQFWPTGDRGNVRPEVYELELGAMDPVGLETGKDSRLSNLSFFTRDDAGEAEFDREDATFTFRLWAGLDESETLDADAQTKLRSFYDPFSKEGATDPLDVDDEEDDETGEHDEADGEGVTG